MKYTIEDLFTIDSVNIFTDGGIYRDRYGITAIYSNIIVVGNNPHNYQTKVGIESDSTSNRGELLGLLYGIQEAILYRNMGYRNIRIFTDSNLTKSILMNYINKWIYSGGYLYKSDNKTMVENQDIILEIVRLVTQNNLNFELYHISGHLGEKKQKTIGNAKYKFIKLNNINVREIKDEYKFELLIKELSLFNKLADKACNNYATHMRNYNHKKYRSPIYFIPTPEQLNSMKYNITNH